MRTMPLCILEPVSPCCFSDMKLLAVSELSNVKVLIAQFGAFFNYEFIHVFFFFIFVQVLVFFVVLYITDASLPT